MDNFILNKPRIFRVVRKTEEGEIEYGRARTIQQAFKKQKEEELKNNFKRGTLEVKIK